MADERLRTTDTQPHATVVERRGGGMKAIIAIAVIVLLLAVAYAVFGRRSGEGAKQNAVGALTPPVVVRSA